MPTYFDHEKLEAHKKAVAFAAGSESILERITKASAVHGQLDRAGTLIVLNIPEGNGRFSPADRCRFFDIARASALECAGCLDLFFVKRLRAESELQAGTQWLKSIVALLAGLIRRQATDRVHDEMAEYGAGGGKRD